MRHYTTADVHEKVYGTAGQPGELECAVIDYTGLQDTWLVGFVTHANNVADEGITPYADLFSKLSSLGLTLEPLSSIADYFPYTQLDPENAPPDKVCPPE